MTAIRGAQAKKTQTPQESLDAIRNPGAFSAPIEVSAALIHASEKPSFIAVEHLHHAVVHIELPVLVGRQRKSV